MGAAFVVTGSVNQACVESGASEYTKKLLAQAKAALEKLVEIAGIETE